MSLEQNYTAMKGGWCLVAQGKEIGRFELRVT